MKDFHSQWMPEIGEFMGRLVLDKDEMELSWKLNIGWNRGLNREQCLESEETEERQGVRSIHKGA